MFFHILKKDLLKKKTMNIILMIFIMLSSMFLASSISNLKIVFTAVDHFIEAAKTPDFFILSTSDVDGDKISDFLFENSNVSDFYIQHMYSLANDQIKITKCQNDSTRTSYERSSSLGLSKIPTDSLKVYNDHYEPLILRNGEIAIPRLEAERNNLSLGDTLEITVGDIKKEFTVSYIIKDAVFGSSMMGFKRFFISDEDYSFFANDDLTMINVYSINCSDSTAFQSSYRSEQFNVISMVDRNSINYCYIMDMLVSTILILVSICLILIAFLILRFTISFTIQEDYRQIGIMKAIGLSDFGIRKLYLIKYLVIAVIGSVVGLILSFPFGSLILTQTGTSIEIESATSNIWINLGSSLLIILIVLAFCYQSTRKINKFSAIESIRSGSNGERYHSKNKILLHSKSKMSPSLYIALNDILSGFRKYIALTIIFIIGTLMILLPLSATNTMRSNEMFRSFSLVTSDACMDNDNSEVYVISKDNTQLLADMDSIKNDIEEKGYTSEVWAEIDYYVPVYTNNPDEKYSYFTFQSIGDAPDSYDLLEGEMPLLPNEIMITDKSAKEMQVGIGDHLHFCFSDSEEDFLITGIFQSLMNMGKGYRVSDSANLESDFLAGFMGIQVEINELSEAEAVQLLKDMYPEYKIRTNIEYTERFIGNITEQMDMLQLFIVLIVLIINCLITALMIKTMFTRDRTEIALLKSLGISNISIRKWQAGRILLILSFSVILGVIFSKILIPITIRPIFGIMGAAQMKIVVNPLENYVLYPLLLLFSTALISFLCTGEIREVQLQEINNQE